MRRLHFALLSLVLVLGSQPLVAVTYYVTPNLQPCSSLKSGFVIFPSIQYAVTNAPAGSTINVCPGTYAEQVVISQPLTLRGVSYGGSSQAVIAMPSKGLALTPSVYFSTVAAQVQVTAGLVTISNITVDGTAGSSNCPLLYEDKGYTYFGIFYSSGSSGTVNEVEARNQNCDTSGIGIGAENGSGAAESVTIENSNINGASIYGIYACSEESPSTLTVSIRSNHIAGANGESGIASYCNLAGSVSDNVISGDGVGVYAVSPSATVSGNTISTPYGGIGIYVWGAADISDNTISGAGDGIYLTAPATVTSNRISNSSTYGIGFWAPGAAGATVKSNIITQAPIGIEFSCMASTVSGNTINGATTGLDSIPASFTGVNTFYNVATNTTSGGC
jgi:parallel beta-helix repeat protein